jgi:hypothetical protein
MVVVTAYTHCEEVPEVRAISGADAQRRDIVSYQWRGRVCSIAELDVAEMIMISGVLPQTPKLVVRLIVSRALNNVSGLAIDHPRKRDMVIMS